MNAFRALTIDVDGTTAVQTWDTTDDTLPHLQRAVGGCVDVVALTGDLDMWLNDEGLLIGLPVNILATGIAALHGLTHQVYVGPVVLTGGADAEGNTLPLTEQQVQLLQAYVAVRTSAA